MRALSKKHLVIFNRIISLLITAALSLSIVVAGTQAWFGLVGVLNSFHGENKDDNNNHDYGDVRVTKKVENEDGSELTEEQKNRTFNFRITFSDGNKYKYEVDGGNPKDLGDGETSEDGKVWYYFSLKHNETAVFIDVPDTVEYTVEELNLEQLLAEGYAVSSNNHTGQLHNSSAHAVFVNTYKKESTLEIQKTVSSNGDRNIDFEFQLFLGDETDTDTEYIYVKNGESIKFRNGDIIKLKHGDSIVFDSLPIGLPYKIIEKDYTEDGYVSFPGEYNGFVTREGTILPFINYKNAPTDGTLEISKEIVPTVDHNDIDEDYEFTFYVEFSDGNVYNYIIDGEIQERKLNKGIDEDGKEVYYLTLRHGQTARFLGLPALIDYVVKEKNEYNYIAARDSISGQIAADGTSKAPFQNAWYDPENPWKPAFSELLIKKEVVGIEIDESIEFTFEIRFGDNKTYPYTLDGDESTLHYLKDGKYLTLKHGQSATFVGLPVGMTYQVRELQDSDGYTPSIEEVEGNILLNLIIENEFDNYKVVDWDNGNLTVTKRVSGEDADENEQFTFYVEFDDEKVYDYIIDEDIDNPLPLKDGCFTIKHGQRVSFVKVPKGVGFKVLELISNYNYLPDMQFIGGEIVGGYSIDCYITNEKVIDTELIIEKKVEGEGADKNKEFTFVLTIDDEVQTFKLKHGEKKIFHLLEGSVYKVEELNENMSGYVLTEIQNGFGTATGGVVHTVLTNTYEPDIIKKTSINASKVWDDDNYENRPEEVMVQLYKNGEPHGAPVALNAANNWNHTWTGILKVFDWSVDEIVEPDEYTKSITGNAKDGFVIINSHKTRGGKGSGGEDDENYVRDDTIYEDISSSGAQVDKTDYRSAAAKTGDDTKVWGWLALLVVSSIALRVQLFYNGKRKQKLSSGEYIR